MFKYELTMFIDIPIPRKIGTIDQQLSGPKETEMSPNTCPNEFTLFEDIESKLTTRSELP
jgi:hypothetical protein